MHEQARSGHDSSEMRPLQKPQQQQQQQQETPHGGGGGGGGGGPAAAAAAGLEFQENVAIVLGAFLFTILLVLVVAAIFKRCRPSRCNHQPQHHQRHHPHHDHDYEQQQQQQQQQQRDEMQAKVKAAVSESVYQRWRSVASAAAAAEDENEEVDLCGICLADLGHGQTVRLMPCCRQIFHSACIDTWLLVGFQPSCPSCRLNLLDLLSGPPNSNSNSASTSTCSHTPHHQMPPPPC